jgi:hypothetical protein
MTLSIESTRTVASTPACAEAEPEEPIEACAPLEPRAARAEADAAVAHRVAAKIEVFVADLFSLIQSCQAQSRDTQSSTQERNVDARSVTASQAHSQRTTELETAITDRARAAESSAIGDIFRVLGSIVSVAVGTLGAVFTGGASLVAAIAVVVAIVGPLVMNELGKAGVVDPDTAAAVGIGIAAVCTLVSMGSSVASLAGAASTAALVAVDAATRTVIDVASNVGAIVGGLADIGAGSTQVATAVLNHDAAGHETNATVHGQRRDAEREVQEQAMELLRALLGSFGRVSESLAACREESTRARRIALRVA